MKKYYNYYGIAILLCALLLSACSKMDGTYKDFIQGGEIRYSERPDTIGIDPGHNRVRAWMAVSTRNISKFKVFWNNRADSVEVPVSSENKTDTLSTLIESLEEGSYTFEFFTYDAQGNASIAIDTTGEVFGDQYQESLNPRLVKTAEKFSGKGRILWESVSQTQMTGTELHWTDSEGKQHRMLVENQAEVSEISPLPADDIVISRGIYRPHPQAIDSFFSAPAELRLTPREPIELDKAKFEEYRLPSDAPLSRYAKDGMEALWDGELTNTKFYGTETKSGSPHWFTFDLGVKATLSEMLYFQRATDNHKLLFANANAREFEIWGSNDPNPDGSWDESWVKLMDCTSQKPSGLPLGELGDADILQAEQGESFSFPEGVPPVRYIRIKVLGNWDPSTNDRSFMAELTFYGLID